MQPPCSLWCPTGLSSQSQTFSSSVFLLLQKYFYFFSPPSPISPAFRQKSPRNAFVLRIFFVTGAHPGFSNIWTWQLSGPEAPKSTLWRRNITEKTNKAHEYCKTLQFWFRKTWSLKSIYNQSFCASLFEKSQIPLLVKFLSLSNRHKSWNLNIFRGKIKFVLGWSCWKYLLWEIFPIHVFPTRRLWLASSDSNFPQLFNHSLTKPFSFSFQ